MTAKDLKPFMVLERDEPSWDDDNVLEPVRYRVEYHWGEMMLRHEPFAGGGSLRSAPHDLRGFRMAS